VFSASQRPHVFIYLASIYILKILTTAMT